MKQFICIFFMLMSSINQLFSKTENDSVRIQAMVVKSMNLWHIIDSIAKGDGSIVMNNYSLCFQEVKKHVVMLVIHEFYNDSVVDLMNGKESIYDKNTRVLGYVTYNGIKFFILSYYFDSQYIYKMIQPINVHTVLYRDKKVHIKGVFDICKENIGFFCEDGVFTQIFLNVNN